MLKQEKTWSAIGSAMLFITAFGLTGYFVFAAIQGDYGHFRRIQIEADEKILKVELTQLNTKRALLQNKTRRLSDNFLDLDLLDERARKILGMARGNDIIIK